MELFEKTVSSEIKFKGHIVTLRLDQAELPNGRTAAREVVEHPGGVAILPLHDDGSVTWCASSAIPSSGCSPSFRPGSWNTARITVWPPCGN